MDIKAIPEGYVAHHDIRNGIMQLILEKIYIVSLHILVDIVYVEVIKMLISKYGNGSVELVEEFENKYGIKLDEEYRDFLIKYNGGDTPLTSVKRGKRKEDLRYLYGIKTKRSSENEFEYFDWEKSQCIPIGEDCFGNYFAIGITEENKGVIYFCDHERGFRKTKISDSFKNFVSNCNSDLLGKIRTPEEREKTMIEKGNAHLLNDGLKEAWKKEYEYYKDMMQEEVIL